MMRALARSPSSIFLSARFRLESTTTDPTGSTMPATSVSRAKASQQSHFRSTRPPSTSQRYRASSPCRRAGLIAVLPWCESQASCRATSTAASPSRPSRATRAPWATTATVFRPFFRAGLVQQRRFPRPATHAQTARWAPMRPPTASRCVSAARREPTPLSRARRLARRVGEEPIPLPLVHSRR